jgi:hypothetical protein
VDAFDSVGAFDVLDVTGVAVADPPHAMAAKANIANVSPKNRVCQVMFKVPIRFNLGNKKPDFRSQVVTET